ncbi:MAG: hypothetical protein F6K36_30420 [Symploca sp. SIO3C6]|nr:hypothetical protein [Symploca sp. SIO3C6]
MDQDRMACENYWIQPGAWRRINRAEPYQVISFCSDRTHILHTHNKYVHEPWLRSCPIPQRRTLELIRTNSFQVTGDVRSTGTRWKGTFSTVSGQRLENLPITDPVMAKRLDTGHMPSSQCLVTMSLGLPYPPPNWEGDAPCWKLIAGVIELSTADLILIEMQRVGWSINEGRSFIEKCYGKRSRQHLTTGEQIEFLHYLQTLGAIAA